MHEMGVVLNIIRTVENIAKQNEVEKVGAIVLELGELSAVMPHFLEECYSMAVIDTILSDTKLVIEKVPGMGICKDCGKTYNLIENDHKCPVCDCDEWDIISGRDLFIKELMVI